MSREFRMIVVLLFLSIFLNLTHSEELFRLATYCATANHCPHSATCDTDHNYCICLPGYSPPDRNLTSCLQTAAERPLNYDLRFTFLQAPCSARINCPPNSYCDPVGRCTCYPGWVSATLSVQDCNAGRPCTGGGMCSFESEEVIHELDERWRGTRFTCRADVNCMEDANCVSGECKCAHGMVATRGIGEGFFTACRVGVGSGERTSAGLLVFMSVLWSAITLI